MQAQGAESFMHSRHDEIKDQGLNARYQGVPEEEILEKDKMAVLYSNAVPRGHEGHSR